MISDCRQNSHKPLSPLSLPPTHSMKFYMIRYFELQGMAPFSKAFLLTA